MVKSIKISLVTVFATLLAVIAISSINVSKANAQDSEQAQPVTTQESENTQEQNNEVYTYTAQPGDSYSLIARKAIQTYGIINNVQLSEAQIIFVETNLTQKAGSPELNKGQKVEVSVNYIKEWSDKAGQLTQEQKDAWNVYAQNANFNTNSVGQSS